MRRLAGALVGGGAGVVLGASLGLAEAAATDLRLEGSFAGAVLALAPLDAAILGALGAVVGLFRPRPWGRLPVAAAALLALPVLVLSWRGAGVVAAGTDELLAVWRQDRPPPRLTGAADDPVVVLISLDTVRADLLSPATMPLLARRAEAGLVHTVARVPSPWTLPAMAAALTGLHWPDHGAAVRAPSGGWTGLSPDAPVLAKGLADRGFVTAAVVTNFFLAPRYGFHRGFDRFANLSRRRLVAEGLRRAALLRPVVPPASDSARAVTDTALAWLDRLRGGRSFLWLHYLDAHAPYQADDADRDAPADCALPGCFHAWDAVRTGRTTLDDGDRARVRALYDADARYLDREVDRFLRGVEDAGLGERALIVLVGDHGEAFWEGGEVEHGGSFSETVLRVPLVVWAPGRAPARSDRAVDVTAIPGAVLDWVDGRGLGGLEPEGPAARTPLGSTLFGEPRVGCTDGAGKLVRRMDGRAQAWDLAADPTERRDVAGSRPDLVAGLSGCVPAVPAAAPLAVRDDARALQALGYAD